MNQILEKIKKNALITYMSQNSGMTIAVFTALITIASFIFKLFNYANLKGYSMFFNVPSQYVKLESNGVVYDILLNAAITLSLAICSYILYFIYNMHKNYKDKVNELIIVYKSQNDITNTKMQKIIRKKIIEKIALKDREYSMRNIYYVDFIILNIFIALFFPSSHKGAIDFFGLIICLMISEVLMASFIKSFDEDENSGNEIELIIDENFDELINEKIVEISDDKDFKKTTSRKWEKIRNMIALVVFAVVYFSLSFGLMGYWQADSLKTFDLAENNQYAIIQRFDGKCLLADVDVKAKVLTINTSEQKVVSEEGLLYKSMTFDKVNVNRNS